MLEGDIEIGILGGNRAILGFYIAYGESFFQVVDAVCDIVWVALGKHFHFSIGGVFDIAEKVIPFGNVACGESEADTLYRAAKNYYLC